MAARFIGFNPLAGFIVAIVFVLVAVFSTLPVRADVRILSSSGGDRGSRIWMTLSRRYDNPARGSSSTGRVFLPVRLC